MNPKNKVISYKLAREIWETAKKKGIKLPESEWWWQFEYWQLVHGDERTYKERFPAYGTDKLLEMLPKRVSENRLIGDSEIFGKGKDVYLQLEWDGERKRWWAGYYDISTGMQIEGKSAKSPAEALGKLLLYLLEKGVVKKLNKTYEQETKEND